MFVHNSYVVCDVRWSSKQIYEAHLIEIMLHVTTASSLSLEKVHL